MGIKKGNGIEKVVKNKCETGTIAQWLSPSIV